MRRGKPFLAEAYRNVTAEYPSIKNVQVLDRDIAGNAYYSAATHFQDGQIRPTMNFNFSHTDTYLRPENLQAGETFGLEYVLKTIALKTGARPAEIMQNERLVSTFIMMHEFGHAVDFQENYLLPEVAKLDGHGKGVRALPEALAKDQADRLKDLMTQPIPSQVSADCYTERVYPFRRRLRAFGIDPHDPTAVASGMRKGYRKMPSESFADEFATKYIMRHYDDFFSSSTSAPDKVQTHVGEFMKISKDIDLLGLDEGKAVSLTRVELAKDPSGQIQILDSASPKTNTGFLKRSLKIGDGIELAKTSDPANPDSYSKSPAIKNVYIRPKKNAENEVENDIIIQLDGFAKFFRIELTGEEPAEITVPPEEMLQRYHLNTGSKIMLMKRDLQEDSAVHLGSILGGRLEKPDYFPGDSPIQIGHGIHLASTAGERTGVGDLVDPAFMNGGSTSTIDRVYRKWKSYYAETATSTYEIIPYE